MNRFGFDPKNRIQSSATHDDDAYMYRSLWTGWERKAKEFQARGDHRRMNMAYEEAYQFYMKEAVAEICADALRSVRK